MAVPETTPPPRDDEPSAAEQRRQEMLRALLILGGNDEIYQAPGQAVDDRQLPFPAPEHAGSQEGRPQAPPNLGQQAAAGAELEPAPQAEVALETVSHLVPAGPRSFGPPSRPAEASPLLWPPDAALLPSVPQPEFHSSLWIPATVREGRWIPGRWMAGG